MFLLADTVSQMLFSGAVAVIIVYLVYVAITDYSSLRISNRSVMIGLILYPIWVVVGGAADPVTDLIAAALLFGLGFAFWMFRLLGAGDAKFMLVCGALAGLSHLAHFAIALVVVSIAMFIVIKLAARPMFQSLIVMSRLGTIVDTQKAPYGVALSTATIFAFLARSTGGM